MELEPTAFLRKYNLEGLIDESDIINRLKEIQSESPTTVIALSKNLIVLRIIQIATSIGAIREPIKSPSDRVSKAFKAKKMKRVFSRFSIDSDAYLPKIHMKSGPALTSCLMIFLWSIFVTIIIFKLLWNHIEIFLSGLGIDLIFASIPFLPIIYGAPILIQYLLFPSLVAEREIEGVQTFRELGYKMHLLNPHLYVEKEFERAVIDIQRIQQFML